MARILIIEDEESIRKLFRTILEREGYEVDIAADGEIGLRMQRANPADLIITDMFMPEKEGIETIMDLKRENPGIKIIAISGGGAQGNLDYLSIARNLGAAKTLAKPIPRLDLIAAVEEVLA